MGQERVEIAYVQHHVDSHNEIDRLEKDLVRRRLDIGQPAHELGVRHAKEGRERRHATRYLGGAPQATAVDRRGECGQSVSQVISLGSPGLRQDLQGWSSSPGTRPCPGAAAGGGVQVVKHAFERPQENVLRRLRDAREPQREIASRNT